MEKYTAIHLYLDRDSAGRKCTEKALKWSSKYKDCSSIYQQSKDLNEWLIQHKNASISETNLLRKNENKLPSQKQIRWPEELNQPQKEKEAITKRNTKRMLFPHRKGRRI